MGVYHIRYSGTACTPYRTIALADSSTKVPYYNINATVLLPNTSTQVIRTVTVVSTTNQFLRP